MEPLQNSYLTDIFSRLEAVSRAVETDFGALNAEQLNWRPKPKQWSIAQILQHLMKANKAYFPVLVQVADGMKRQRKREKVPVLPDIWGRFLRNSLSADSKRKLKAPDHLQPSQKPIPDSIVADYIEHQEVLRVFIERTDKLDHPTTIITSPSTGYVTYSLKDCCAMFANHAERHLKQAQAVRANLDFPAPAL